MTTTGTVVIGQAAYEVTGASWLDRQWGGLPSFYAAGPGDGAQAHGGAAPHVMN